MTRSPRSPPPWTPCPSCGAADALHCQREHATYLHRRGGHFLCTVQGNQPALRRPLAALPWGQVGSLRRRHVGHGRVDSRSIKVIDLDGHPTTALFPPAARAIKVVRRRRRQTTDTTSMEIVYAVTALDYRQANPPCSRPGCKATRRSRTPCPTSATSPQVRTTPASEPDRHHRSWPRCATPRSTSTGWTDTPTSPAHSGKPAGDHALPSRPSTPHEHPEYGQVSPPDPDFASALSW